jgi:hypothetical protein
VRGTEREGAREGVVIQQKEESKDTTASFPLFFFFFVLFFLLIITKVPNTKKLGQKSRVQLPI